MNDFSDLHLLCVYCFDTIIEFLSKKHLENFPKIPMKKFPIFISWTKLGKLRGCIGTFIEEDLSRSLPKYTLISAFEDFRFNPISTEEIPHLNCGVSLLVNFEKIEDPFNWEIGIHGILIEFDYNGQKFRGTYLPEVAKEQNWDQKQALSNLIKKAGSKENLESVINLISTTRYQSVKANLHYNDYNLIKLKAN